MDQCIQEGRFAASGRTGYQNIAMISDRLTQTFLLLWRHDSGIHVLIEGEYPARPFTHGKYRGRHDWRNLAREAGSVEREFAFDRGVVACEGRMMISGDRPHRGVGATCAHRSDRL